MENIVGSSNGAEVPHSTAKPSALPWRLVNGTWFAYMWNPDEITIEIDDADAEVMIVTITTPAGVVELIGAVRVLDGVLTIDRVHVQGLTPGALGRSGLNAIGRKLMVEADVHEIVIQGGTRTTGRNKGKKPRAIRFPHQAAAERPRRRGPPG